MRILHYCLSVALLVVLSGTASAQDSFKPTNGPYGGDLFDYDISNDGTIYTVTVNFDAYRSIDDGRSWQRLASNANDTTPQWLETVAVDSSGRVFIGGDHGIWHSTDRGDSWRGSSVSIEALIGDELLQILMLEVNRRGVVLAYFYSQSEDSVLIRSTDGGVTFAPVTIAGGGNRLTGLMATPEGTFLASTHVGMFRSTDDGASWSPVGFTLPPSETVRFLEGRHSQSWMISSTSRQLFRSSDDGLTWVPVEATGLPIAAAVTSMATTRVGTILATVDNAGLYRSIDGGASWSRSGDATDGVAAAPSGTVIAGSSTPLRSEDDGLTWSPTNHGLITSAVTKLTEGPDGALYAASQHMPFRSTNAGATWDSISAGVPRGRMRDIQFDPQGRLWLSTESSGVYRSTNRGDAWTPVSAGFVTQRVYDLLFVGANAFAATDSGLHISTSGGDTWSRIDGEFRSTPTVSLALAPDGAILAGSATVGVLRSTDNGATWGSSNDGLNHTLILALLTTRAGTVFAAARGGIYRSLDSGRTWQFTGRHHYASEPRGLTEMRNGTIYAGAYDVARSVDNGLKWQLYLDVPFYNYFLVPAVLQHSSGRIYIGTLGAGVGEMVPELGERWKPLPVTATRATAANGSVGLRTLLATDQGIFHLNRGRLAPKWEAYPVQIDGRPRINAIDFDRDGRIAYAAASDGLYMSLDDRAWTKLEGDLPPGAITAIGVNPIAGVALVGTSAGIYFSISEGATWNRSTSGPNGPVTSFLVSGYGSGQMYAAASGGGVWRTEDGGWNWTKLSTGLPAGDVVSLTQSPRGDLYAAVSGTGIYRSTDNGMTWVALAGLVGRTITSIAMNSFDVLFAGTDVGIFRSSDGGERFSQVNTDYNGAVSSVVVIADGSVIATTESDGAFISSRDGAVASIAERSKQVSESLVLAIAGNPLVDRASLHIGARRAGAARLALVDALGETARVLFDGKLEAGEHALALDRDGLAAGLYFVTLTQGEESVAVPVSVP